MQLLSLISRLLTLWVSAELRSRSYLPYKFLRFLSSLCRKFVYIQLEINQNKWNISRLWGADRYAGRGGVVNPSHIVYVSLCTGKRDRTHLVWWGFGRGRVDRIQAGVRSCHARLWNKVLTLYKRGGVGSKLIQGSSGRKHTAVQVWGKSGLPIQPFPETPQFDVFLQREEWKYKMNSKRSTIKLFVPHLQPTIWVLQFSKLRLRVVWQNKIKLNEKRWVMKERSVDGSSKKKHS